MHDKEHNKSGINGPVNKLKGIKQSKITSKFSIVIIFLLNKNII